MKTITKSQYLYLKSKKNAYLSKNETVTIEDEEYEDLIQYSNKQITPINNDSVEPEPIEPTPEEPNENEYDYKDSDFGINGIGYKIISLEEKTAAVWILCIYGDVIIPNEVIYNNVEFKITYLYGGYYGVGWHVSNICNTITFNKYINMNNCGEELLSLNTTYFYVNEDNPYMTALNGVLYNKNITKLLSYKNNNDYIMPNSVIELQEYSFHDMILNGIYGCKKIIFNDNIEEIKENSIYMIRTLECLKLSNKIKILPPRILCNLENLKILILPSELEQILTNEYNQNWTTSLENITIYNSNILNYKYIQHIQRWYEDGTIAEDRYENTNIYVFNKLSNLKEIHIIDKNPVELEEGIFTDGKYFTIKVYVPKGCKEIYENTEGWNKFYNIIELDE